MAKWLVKSEPNTYSIEDLQSEAVTAWDGVRNYQARNFLCEMKVGDEVLFYHSVIDPIGVVGIAKVSKIAYPDPTQFDKNSAYFDSKASQENPRWWCPNLKFYKKFGRTVALSDLRDRKSLAKMILLKKGSRLSVQPVSEAEFKVIVTMGK